MKLKGWSWWNQKDIHQLRVWSTNGVLLQGFNYTYIYIYLLKHISKGCNTTLLNLMFFADYCRFCWSSSSRFPQKLGQDLHQIWYILIDFLMNFICISYAFFMHFIFILYALLNSACLFNKSTCTFIKNTCIFEKCI